MKSEESDLGDHGPRDDAYSPEKFRRSVLKYLGGRGGNAVLAFATLVSLARGMEASEYAAYVSAVALVEIAMLVSSFGLEWVTAIYIPQIRIKASGAVLARFIVIVLGVQGVAAAAFGLLMFIFSAHIGQWTGIEYAGNVFRLYGAVVFLEGVSRVVRDQVLPCLLFQGASQLAQLGRNGILLTLVSLELQIGAIDAVTVAWFEIIASSGSLLLGLAFLVRGLWMSRRRVAADPAWTLPDVGRLMKMGRAAWIANLASLAWGPQLIVLLCARLLGAEVGAVVGFARNLMEQIRRYLPAELLYGVIRPVLVARYVGEGDLRRLAGRCGLLFKLNLTALAGVAITFAVGGERIVEMLSNGRYAEGHILILCWLIAFAPWCQRRFTDLLAHALGRSVTVQNTSARLVLAPIVIYLMLVVTRNPVAALVVVGACEYLYSRMILRRIADADDSLVDWSGAMRIGLVACVAAVAGVWLNTVVGSDWRLIMTLPAAFSLFLALLLLVSPLSSVESDVLPLRAGRLLGRFSPSGRHI